MQGGWADGGRVYGGWKADICACACVEGCKAGGRMVGVYMGGARWGGGGWGGEGALSGVMAGGCFKLVVGSCMHMNKACMHIEGCMHGHQVFAIRACRTFFGACFMAMLFMAFGGWVAEG